ncbi:hypothetical protein IWQ60_001695 [Tieghemiomyces parasiticus]|uniref:Extracellular metalloproteinase n=1 Tax=Tieghemiomyces parasiticus TaxID=78921 RepID=A0A9W8ADP6_9FUNG|nr:hypothetical protein IWQ60_001695 [Tieghemiomyces parasiticus]
MKSVNCILVIILALTLAGSTPARSHALTVESFGPSLLERTFQVVAPTGHGTKLRPRNSRRPDSAVPHAHLATRSLASGVDHATTFAKETFNLTDSDYYMSSSVESDFGMTHVYLNQLVHGFPVQNGVMNINVDREGRVLSYGSTFVPSKDTLGAHPVSVLVKRDNEGSVTLSPVQALLILARTLGYNVTDTAHVTAEPTRQLDTDFPAFTITSDDLGFSIDYEIQVTPSFLITDAEGLEAGYAVQFRDATLWLEAFVALASAEVTSLVHWSADATYRVFPLGTVSEIEGPRQLVIDPEDKQASPEGWVGHLGTTSGNNVHAQENWTGRPAWKANYRPHVTNATTGFDFPLDMSIANAAAAVDSKAHIDATITNLFYWCNWAHDLFYHYGFTEAAGNFQDHNFGRGGDENDAVVAFAQTGSGRNSAVFVTPPDGRQPVMRMYLWDRSMPVRDGALTSDIIIHEYTHGVSTRLTGGRKNVGCLGWDEAAAMSEGWGDFFAVILHLNATATRTTAVAIGAYVTPGGHGLRPYPYTTNLAVNPATYADVYRPNTPFQGSHENGMIWAAALFEVYWNLVDKLGFDPDWTSARTNRGNSLAALLVVTGMKLQPCYPNFVQARDAILQADAVITHGEHRCEIWQGFAKRGLGWQAQAVKRSKRTADFTLPPECV